MKKLIFGLLSFGAFGASLAHAGFYGRAGALWAFDDAVEIAKSRDYKASVDSTAGITAALGYKFSALRLEGELNYINANIGDTDASDVTTDGALKKTSAFANVLFELPVPLIKPYLGAGVGVTQLKLDLKQLVSGSSSESAFSSSADETQFAFQVMAGVRVSVLKTLTAYAGYRYHSSGGLSTTQSGYSLDTKNAVSYVELGVGFGF